jgi:hypothetical protein
VDRVGDRLQGLAKTQVGGRVEGRVASQDHQRLDGAAAHLLDQGGEVVSAGQVGVAQFVKSDRLPDAAQGLIDGENQCLNRRGLTPSRHDQGLGTRLAQVFDHSLQPV